MKNNKEQGAIGRVYNPNDFNKDHNEAECNALMVENAHLRYKINDLLRREQMAIEHLNSLLEDINEEDFKKIFTKRNALFDKYFEVKKQTSS